VRKLALFGAPSGAVMASTSSGERPSSTSDGSSHHRVRADAIADEVRSVFAEHDALPEHVLANFTTCARILSYPVRHDLEELHVTDGLRVSTTKCSSARPNAFVISRCEGPTCSRRRCSAPDHLLEALEEACFASIFSMIASITVAVLQLVEVVLGVAIETSRALSL